MAMQKDPSQGLAVILGDILPVLKIPAKGNCRLTEDDAIIVRAVIAVAAKLP